MDLDPQMDAMLQDADVSVQLQCIHLELASGGTPDPQQVLKTAEHLETAIEHWEIATTKMKLWADFSKSRYVALAPKPTPYRTTPSLYRSLGGIFIMVTKCTTSLPAPPQ